MADLVVIIYDTEQKASEVLAKLKIAKIKHTIDLEDAVVVTKSKKGKTKIHQTADTSTAGKTAVKGSILGLLVGIIFMVPVFGLLFGAGLGALFSRIKDLGLDDDFVKQIGKSLQPEHSAIFLLVRKADPQKALEILAPFEGTVYQTSLPKEAEDLLKETLKKEQQEDNA